MRSIFFALMFLSSAGSIAQTNNELYNKQLIAQFDQLYNKPFPIFDLEDNNGNLFNTASLKGKTVYVDFWFTQCPPCLKEIPYAKALQTYFSGDTNIVFLNICIEYAERKQAWKEMIKAKEIGGINLFYAKNKPQKVNLLREYKVDDYPTYMIVNSNMNIIGHNSPAPTDKGLVQWVIYQASNNTRLSEAYRQWINNTKELQEYLAKNLATIEALQPKE